MSNATIVSTIQPEPERLGKTIVVIGASASLLGDELENRRSIEGAR